MAKLLESTITVQQAIRGAIVLIGGVAAWYDLKMDIQHIGINNKSELAEIKMTVAEDRIRIDNNARDMERAIKAFEPLLAIRPKGVKIESDKN